MEIKKPIFCDIGITEKCIFKCQMCKLWQNTSEGSELSIDEWKNFIVSLEEFGGNDVRIHIAGGEPLLKESVLDLVGFAARKKFTTVMVTNGFLISEDIARQITVSGLDVVSVSIDSLDDKVHDFLRGTDGALRNALQAVKNMRASRVKSISILSVIMGPNLGDIIELAEWANENEDISSIYFQAVAHPLAAPKDESWFKTKDYGFLWPADMGELNLVLDTLIAYKEKGSKISNSLRQLNSFKKYFAAPLHLRQNEICTQGDYVISVRPNGDVFLCGAMPSIGNIRKQRIKDLWYSSLADRTRKNIYKCRENCLNVLNCFENKELT